jgi:hypothetical protein
MLKRVLLALLALLVLTLAAVAGTLLSPLQRFRGFPDPPPVAVPTDSVAPARELRRVLSVLAHDSMMGRETGSPGARRAARFLMAELERRGARPAFPGGFVQEVPLVAVRSTRGRRRLYLPHEVAPRDSARVEGRVTGWNLAGLVPGSHPDLAREVVVVSAHYDHVGVGDVVQGDSIYNGADDDGSGVLAALEVARAMAAAPPPRSVLVLLTTAEEFGIRGARWYVDHPAVPLARTVADLNLEMVGRPDPKVGGPGWSWLTGWDEGTIRETVRGAGVPVGPDPRPWRRYHHRSDHVAFVRAGVMAHTLSSYGDHSDLHRPSDEVEAVDFRHLATVIQSVVALTRELASTTLPGSPAPGRSPSG